MSTTLFVLLFLSLTLASADDNVVVLSSDNWKEELNKHEFTAIKFYAPWCGHCKKLAPVWEDLAGEIKQQHGDKVLLAKIDCTINTDKCSDVRSYPTLKFYRKDVADDDQYDGERDLSTLKTWVETKMKGHHSDVVEFANLGELDKAATEYDAMFVFFYAPWCGWCKRIKPVIEKVGTHFNLKSDNKKLLVAKIDAVANNNAAATKYEIKVFPTFYYMRNKRLQIHPTVGTDYGRTYEQFVDWLTPRRGPSSTQLTPAGIAQFRTETPYTRFIAYFDDTTSKEFEKWKTATEGGILDDFGRAHVIGSASRKSGVVVAESSDGTEIATFDLSSTNDFKQFVIKHGYPYGSSLLDQHLRAQATTKVPLFVALYQGTPTDEQLVPYKEASEAIAGRMLTGWSTDEEQAVKWGASGTKYPTAVVVRGLGSQDTYFVPYNEDTETWDTASIVNYLKQVEKDTYPRYIRSEPVPETQVGDVVTVVGKTFEDIVFDETKDVFVEFYAPWCGHCKKLAPIWDELATLFKPLDDIVVAKIDATSNTLPRGINANSFPTIMWFPKNNKLPTPYNQGRTLDNFKRFILSSATRKNIDLDKEALAYQKKQKEKSEL
eukprot:TRINITY_DN267_c0_g1_i2.p1 TRINITY_DN267_c0_g1~~TRINITY_DN267_c0_g1_i2.p1  ORF type:complete len:639 (+),score=168.49 TRINITY_DN267_c0_g1_i2:108-1919(+)